MSKLNPIEQSKQIENAYRIYLESSFSFKDADYQKCFEEELEKSTLYKGPYLSMSVPFTSAHSLNELIDIGTVSPLFKKLNGINLDQKLYWHQERALELVAKGHSLVVTTGTGSGKTECFLYPLFNEIMKDIEKGKNESGIRAIFLYPMNALVNDQIQRIRHMLQSFPDITFGFFTGDTENNITRQKYEKRQGDFIPDNELVSREEIRDNPPHLLFTNYSMLEYLLIRPNDSIIFEPKYLKNWKYIVLDEAHTYTGAKGIEVALLLRRVMGLSPVNPKFILTSATLGKQNQSEREIIEFAQSLTSSSYSVDDIIFAKRDYLNPNYVSYSILPEDYCELEKNLENIEAIADIASYYGCKSIVDAIPKLLYDLLIHDRNVYIVYECLKESSITFSELFRKLTVQRFTDEKQLVSLIHLLNVARKNHKSIYDIKYHSFVSTLQGAYITLGKKKTLRLTNHDFIDGFKAFEIGHCRNCNTPYIIGKISSTGYLLKNNEVDIYDNYGDQKVISVDFFLIKDLIDTDEVDMGRLQQYTVCSKCGKIRESNILNADTCDCGKEYEVELLKVVQDKETSNNNIYKCPCCSYTSNKMGIVHMINLGKDEGTAVIGNALFDAIDPRTDDTYKKVTKKKGFIRTPTLIQNKPSKSVDYKQFLAFSDSRQQAAFFSLFFKRNHEKFLKKRLLYNALENNDMNSLRISELIAVLRTKIDEQHLFDNELDAEKNAWLTVLEELLLVDGNKSAEGLGLYYFYLNIDDVLDQFDDESIDETFGEYGLNRVDLNNLIQILFMIFRTAPAINYDKAGLSYEECRDYLSYRGINRYIALHAEGKEKNTVSYIPKNPNAKNQYLNYVQRLCKVDRSTAMNEIMEVLFGSIGIESELFTPTSDGTSYRINADKYILKSTKNHKMYICPKCKRITPYNIHGVCPTIDCEGVLEELGNEGKNASSNYYRKLYQTMRIEPLVVREHTAQLNNSTARQYQQAFKDKKINVLSCSTTFEMGVDIGGLETVFMRNVPPTPANYVQRAGRAGRREDSSAFVLTFCSSSSHDYTYFNHPEEMISGSIQPPHFTITNEKIILRHLIAASLGFFFKLNPQYFNNVGSFVLDGGVEALENYIQSHPQDLNRYIDYQIFMDNPIYNKYTNFAWYDIVQQNDKLTEYEKRIESIITELGEAETIATNQRDYKAAEYYQKQIENIKKEGVVQSLSRYTVIPKYGFPVDVVNLLIYNNGKIQNKFNLSRDLSIAISEYAPGSEVTVQDVKYKSTYITPPTNHKFTRYYYYKCKQCSRINIGLVKGKIQQCAYCGTDYGDEEMEVYFEAKDGFKGIKSSDSSQKKPVRTYSGKTEYIGNGHPDDEILQFTTSVSIQTSSDDELLVMNRSIFYTCPRCGFSKKMGTRSNNLTIDHSHLNIYNRKCENQVLHKHHLGHTFRTDVARICLGVTDKNAVLSFLYALLEGISKVCNIERNDIDGVISLNSDTHSYDLIIYDNVPGGAGHVKRIMNRQVFYHALLAAKDKVSQDCCDENTSCYHCLRNYRNQAYHQLLSRKKALEVVEKIEKELVRQSDNERNDLFEKQYVHG